MRSKLVRLVGFLLLFSGVSLFVVTLLRSGGDGDTPPLLIEAEATPVATQPPPPSVSPIVRLQVPSIDIDAPVINLGVDPDGTMQAPSTPIEVAWYTFSSYPGHGSNAVFAGHYDYVRYGAAVFYNLRELVEGDEIIVRLADGTAYTYRVVSTRRFSSNDAPIEDIIGATDEEVVTLITCDGVFNTSTREYDQRLIVRAERQPATTAQTRS